MARLTIEQAFQLAVRQHQAGELPHAERLYRQILAYQPSHADALHNLGLIVPFDLYRRIDIALDTFPYGGGATTCDALWMGVPVVSLAGKTAVGRGGSSILSNIGLPDLVARSEEAYVQLASDLANDLPRLANLRSTLRHRMSKSPLMDAPRYARNIETAYRQMWRQWCATGPSRWLTGLWWSNGVALIRCV